MDSKRSEKLVGVPNELILKNAEEIVKAGGRLQVRYPIIPKLNDSQENLAAPADFCVKIKDGLDVVQLLPYHRLGAMKYVRLGKKYPMSDKIQAPPAEFMQQTLELFLSKGLPAQIS